MVRARGIWFVVALTLGGTPVAAQSNLPMFLFVAKTGDDANHCLLAEAPCLTFKAAISKAPYDKRVQINVSPGTYEEAISIVGDVHHRIEIYGPYKDEKCIDPTQVVITAPGKIAIWAEDHATVITGCLTVGPATVGVAARQFVILDVGNTRCDQVQICISLTDRSVANCGGFLWVTSSGAYVATANRSDLNFACPVVINPGLTFTAFFHAERQSTIDTTGSSFTNGIDGQKWILSNSEVGPNCDVPGTGATLKNFAIAPSC